MQVVDFGIYSDNIYYLNKSLDQTTEIPARFGLVFGVMFALQGIPENTQIPLTVKIIHPPQNNPAFQTPQTEEIVKPLYGIEDNTLALFRFHEIWQLVPGTWIFQVFYGDEHVGEKAFLVYEAPEEKNVLRQCASVIQHAKLSNIQRCRIEETLPYEAQQAYLTTVAYGEGYDCEAGCIYEYLYALTFEDKHVFPITHEKFLHFSETVTRVLSQKLNLLISADWLKRLATHELIKEEGHYIIRYRFLPYLQGEIDVDDVGQISENVTLASTMLSKDQAQHIPLQELKRLGYIGKEQIIDVTSRGSVSSNSDFLGWSFQARNYHIEVYIDGTVLIYSQFGRILNASKVYGVQEINLMTASWFAEAELAHLGLPKEGYVSGGRSGRSCDNQQCRMITIHHQYPTHTEIYDVHIRKNGVVDISKGQQLLHHIPVSLAEVEEYGAEYMLEDVLRDLDIWPDELYESEDAPEEEDVYLFHYAIVQTRTEEYDVKVSKDGTIQVFQENTLIHQRNIFSQ